MVTFYFGWIEICIIVGIRVYFSNCLQRCKSKNYLNVITFWNFWLIIFLFYMSVNCPLQSKFEVLRYHVLFRSVYLMLWLKLIICVHFIISTWSVILLLVVLRVHYRLEYFSVSFFSYCTNWKLQQHQWEYRNKHIE